MSQRFEGQNLEQALQQAAQSLGVERWQLTYHVVVEKRGFLGGIKRVVIDAEVNENAAPPAAAIAVAAPAPALAPLAAAPPRPASSPTRERGERGRGRGGRDRGGRRGERTGGDDARPRRRRHPDYDLEPGDFEQFLGDVPEQGEQSADAKVVADWCREVIRLSRLHLEVRTEENETQIIVRLYGGDAKRLVERHGELLDAIQVLANKALVGRKVEKEIELDCEAFKDRRTEELGQQARDVADRVRDSGREELMPAMTPIERRIVHLALRDDADVTTESRGDGFYKRVAVIPRPADQPVAEQ